MQYLQNKGHQHHIWLQQKSWISHSDCQDAMDKHLTQYMLIPWSKKWKMLQYDWKFQNRNVRTFGFVNHDTSGQNHGPVWILQSFLLSGICKVVFWQDLWERQFEKILLKHGWEKIPNWECLFVHREKDYSYLFLSGWHQIGWKETKYWSDVESTKQRSWFGRTNIFLWSCILGVHSKTMWNKQRYCGDLQSHVRIPNFRGRNWKTSILREFTYFFMVLWYGRSCEEMCGAILWVIKQDDSTTLQSIYSMHRWSPLQRGRNEICRRIAKYMLSNCSEMLILGKKWTTWYSMVSKEARTGHNKMDQSLWQTSESVDILHSSHMWIQTALLCV